MNCSCVQFRNEYTLNAVLNESHIGICRSLRHRILYLLPSLEVTFQTNSSKPGPIWTKLYGEMLQLGFWHPQYIVDKMAEENVLGRVFCPEYTSDFLDHNM